MTCWRITTIDTVLGNILCTGRALFEIYLCLLFFSHSSCSLVLAKMNEVFDSWHVNYNIYFISNRPQCTLLFEDYINRLTKIPFSQFSPSMVIGSVGLALLLEEDTLYDE